MKCIRHRDFSDNPVATIFVERVSDAKAADMVKKGVADYCPKWAWKAQKDAQNIIKGGK